MSNVSGGIQLKEFTLNLQMTTPTASSTEKRTEFLSSMLL